VVDESLFGEPLKNQLMIARSKSMEAIAGMALRQQEQLERRLTRQVKTFFKFYSSGLSRLVE